MFYNSQSETSLVTVISLFVPSCWIQTLNSNKSDRLHYNNIMIIKININDAYDAY